MAQLDICEVCGKKTKFMFTCPYCKKSLCMEHRRQRDHNCEILVEKPSTPLKEEIVRPLKGSLDPPEEEMEYTVEETQSEFEDSVKTEKEIVEPLIGSLGPPEEETQAELEELVEQEKVIVKQSENKHILKDEDLSPVSEQDSDQFILPELIIDSGSETSETKSMDAEEIVEKDFETLEEDITDSEEEFSIETEQDKKDKQERAYRIVKILTFSSLVLLTIVSISLNGYLYFKVDADKNMILEEYNMLTEKNALIEHQYNELYSEYQLLEEKYELAKASYFELEEELNDTKEYQNYIQIEEMKQITIPPNSNAVFFYEIPAPGYITVEYYSDVEVYAMVGTTLLDDVYYSRNPQGLQKSSELKFSVPVTPNINILFENTNRDNSATVFFGIDYYGQ